MGESPTAVRVLLAEATDRLAAVGVESARYDATALLASLTGLAQTAVVLSPDLDPETVDRFWDLVTQRAARVPLQHLTGRAGFRYLDLQVGPGVFTPRPETELLAGWAVERAQEAVLLRGTAVVVDLCTGSGAIAASLAHEVPQAQVYAVELDPEAVRWAEVNLSGRGVELRAGDMADAFPELDGTVDVVVCNPPYIPLTAYDGVAPEARDHEPALALWSGEDGLDAIRVLERTAARLLAVGGWVGSEHADLQGESAPGVFVDAARWQEVRDHHDLAGRPRYLTARLAR